MKGRVDFLGATADTDLAVELVVDGKDVETVTHEAVTALTDALAVDGLLGFTICIELDREIPYASREGASSSEPSSLEAAGPPAASASLAPVVRTGPGRITA